jgi:hypothetical protein
MKTLAKFKNYYVRFIMTEPVSTSALALSAVAKHGMIAGFGALAHAINAHRSGKTKGFLDFCLLTIMSSFSGVIFALVALHLFDNQYITLAAAGSGGFLGVEGLTILSGKVRDVLANTLTIKK